ncbi:MAG: serine acetyltransferase [Candidatus Zixiibacteriota bacterium]|nr:MAG: serine acetyltransferase [candidate division Zixibacteria bacterium]
MTRHVFQDRRANKGNVKGIFVLAFFRLAQVFARRKGSVLWWLGLPLMIAYRLIVEYIMCIELRPGTQVGPGLILEHGFALVVNDRTVIGANVHLRHSITIGCIKLPDGSQGPSPVIENGVEIGANTCVIGGIRVGNNSKIAAGSVVIRDVPPDVVVAGNPAEVIKQLDSPTATENAEFHPVKSRKHGT